MAVVAVVAVMAVVAVPDARVPFILYLVRFCSSKSEEGSLQYKR